MRSVCGYACMFEFNFMCGWKFCLDRDGIVKFFSHNVLVTGARSSCRTGLIVYMLCTCTREWVGDALVSAGLCYKWTVTDKKYTERCVRFRSIMGMKQIDWKWCHKWPNYTGTENLNKSAQDCAQMSPSRGIDTSNNSWSEAGVTQPRTS